MDYRKMSRGEIDKIRFHALSIGNLQAAVEISEHLKFYESVVKVVKGRKVPHGTIGKVFWLNRKHYGKSEWFGFQTTIGIKTEQGETFFTNVENVEIVKNPERVEPEKYVVITEIYFDYENNIAIRLDCMIKKADENENYEDTQNGNYKTLYDVFDSKSDAELCKKEELELESEWVLDV